MKLSKAQLKVLRLMKSGAEIARSSDRAWLTGGKVVFRNTATALFDRGYTRLNDRRYILGEGIVCFYELTPAGRQALLEAEGAGER